jgi:protein associated with RNAse G/E
LHFVWQARPLHARHREVTQRPSDLTFWRQRWYNVFTNYHEDGTLRYFYCNVAMPPVIEASTVSFVDLDLDVQVLPDGSFRILDMDEFEQHRVRYGYPDWVQTNALRAVNDILALAEAREGPFGILARKASGAESIHSFAKNGDDLCLDCQVDCL